MNLCKNVVEGSVLNPGCRAAYACADANDDTVACAAAPAAAPVVAANAAAAGTSGLVCNEIKVLDHQLHVCMHATLTPS